MRSTAAWDKQSKRIIRSLEGLLAHYAAELEELAQAIFNNPELGFKEQKACAWQSEILKRHGFALESPFAGLDTAYLATAGSGTPTLCFMSEYDALPDIGHACGHNLICTGAMGAGLILRDMLKKEGIPGRVAIMGTPAEESKGGKVIMLQNGALNGIDAALEAHPSYRTTPDCGSTAIQRYWVHYRGKAAHAAASPELGRNALDAVMLLFQGVSAWRQQLPENARIHGIVSDGGVAPNIIPERASALFFLRSSDDRQLQAMVKRFRAIARGAALMSDTSLRIKEESLGYKTRIPNRPFNELFLTIAESVGLDPKIPEKAGRGSTDFGNVSHQLPGVHIYFGIARQVIAAHSIAFREAAGSEYGRKQMLRVAVALAAMGYRYFSDNAFRQAVHADFQSSLAAKGVDYCRS